MGYSCVTRLYRGPRKHGPRDGRCYGVATQPYSSMYEALQEAALKYPQNAALSYYGTRTTYAQLLQQIEQAASLLRAQGLKSGDRVIICLPNIPQFVITFYALNKLGAVACMVHPLSTAPELAEYIRQTRSRFLITLDFLYPQFEGILKNSGIEMTLVTRVEEQLPLSLSLLYFLKQGYKRPNIKTRQTVFSWRTMTTGPTAPLMDSYVFGPREPALILFSGGTTGRAKGVLLSNSNMNALAKEVIAQVKPEPKTDSMLCVLPFFHGFGLGVSLHPVLIAGGCCILVPRFSPGEFAAAIIKNRPAYIAGVPTLFEGFLNNKKIQGMDLSFLKGAYCGGDTTPPELIKRFNSFVKMHRGSATLREGYGLTECVTACSIMPASIYKEGSVGLPFAGTSIRIVDPITLKELPTGMCGEICITGPTLMLGYDNLPEETSQTLREHADGAVWLHTGDLGYLDHDGFLFFVQRIKHIIKSSGYTVYPSQVEFVINSHPLVSDSCVIGIPCSYKGQKVKAFIVLHKRAIPSAELLAEIKGYAAQRLIKWAVPAEIEFCASLPRTKVGKIAHTVLENYESQISQH